MLEDINKVRITREAKFDYEFVVGYTMPYYLIKKETEEYIDRMQQSGRLLWGYYFKCKYYDEEADKMLLLFFYKGIKTLSIQEWELKGVCLAEEWSEELEESGQIRAWLKSELDPMDKSDWVWAERVRAMKKQKLLEMAENENYGEDYEKMVKELLKEYKQNKRKVALGTADIGMADKMDFLDKCLELVGEDGGDLLKDLYIKGLSLSKAAIKYHFSKTGIHKRKEKAIAIIELLFKDRYEI